MIDETKIFYASPTILVLVIVPSIMSLSITQCVSEETNDGERERQWERGKGERREKEEEGEVVERAPIRIEMSIIICQARNPPPPPFASKF